jgi:hypothetical protein
MDDVLHGLMLVACCALIVLSCVQVTGRGPLWLRKRLVRTRRQEISRGIAGIVVAVAGLVTFAIWRDPSLQPTALTEVALGVVLVGLVVQLVMDLVAARTRSASRDEWAFNPPPGWPPAPAGWAPPPGWSPTRPGQLPRPDGSGGCPAPTECECTRSGTEVGTRGPILRTWDRRGSVPPSWLVASARRSRPGG